MKGRFYCAGVASLLFLSGCTYSVTLVHTDGTASDVVDEAATATATPTVNVPLIK